MDSGDQSRPKATDSNLGGLRSQSMSDIINGFFGVKRASVNDLPASDNYTSERSKYTEGRSLETIISPSNEESWILSRFLTVRDENPHSNELRGSSSAMSLDSLHLSDHSQNLQTHQGAGDGGLRSDMGQTSGEKMQFSIGNVPVKPHTVVAKNVEHARRSRNMFSSFMAHDLPLREEKMETADVESTSTSDQFGIRSMHINVPDIGRDASKTSQDDQHISTQSMIPGSEICEKKRHRFLSGNLYWRELNMLASTNDQ